MLWVAAVLAGVAWAEQLPASVFEMSDHLVEISPRDEVDEEDRSQRLEESRSVFVADFLELNASRMIPGLEIVMAADIELESELYMRNEVNITSTRGKVFTLDAGSSSDEKRRVFNVIRTRLCLSDVRMRGGTGDPGAAMIIQDYSTVWLQRVVISANRVLDHNAHGGGIALVGSSYLYLKDSAIGFNEAAHGAALQVTESYAYAENTVFKKNTASNSGGAISMRGDSKAHSAFMRCSYCVIKGNEANFLGFFPMPGGAISVETGADFYCEYSQIKQNTGMSDVDAKAKSTATGTLFDISDVTTSTHHSGIAEFTQVSYEPSPAPSLPRTPGPSVPPTPLPTAFPSTAMPSTATPSLVPTSPPTSEPTTADPTPLPAPDPTPVPAPDPTSYPTPLPTPFPTASPTATPTSLPTEGPTACPTVTPTATPTLPPTEGPTAFPAPAPTPIPTLSPTGGPTSLPAPMPTLIPTLTPTLAPSQLPASSPTNTPVSAPSLEPISLPSSTPTNAPAPAPSHDPTACPAPAPSHDPTTTPSLAPTNAPALTPSATPTATPFATPSLPPSNLPSNLPTEDSYAFDPSTAPTRAPKLSPSTSPTSLPSPMPTTAIPSIEPTPIPTLRPTKPVFYTPAKYPPSSYGGYGHKGKKKSYNSPWNVDRNTKKTRHRLFF